MRKKRFIMISLLMAFVPCMGLCFEATARVISLQVGILDPTYNQTNPQKAPVLIPEVNLEGYTLTFDASCHGCELRLLDEDGILIYATTITSDTLVLPTCLSGNYNLQIIRGNFCFYGYISL